MKRNLLIISFIVLGVALMAQELNCNLQINSDKVQGSNKEVFKTLQKEANEFINNRRWTDLTYAEEERIDCNINIIISIYVRSLDAQS